MTDVRDSPPCKRARSDESIADGTISTALFVSNGTKYKPFGDCMQDRATHMVLNGSESLSRQFEQCTVTPLLNPGPGANKSFVMSGFSDAGLSDGSAFAFGVYDGHGLPGGDIAARIAKERLEKSLALWSRDSPFDGMIKNAYDEAHTAIVDQYDQVLTDSIGERNGRSQTARQITSRLEFGTTASVIIIDRIDRLWHAHLANCGDSEIVLGRVDEDGAVSPIKLSQIHNGSNGEAERVLEHGMTMKSGDAFVFRTPSPHRRGISLSRALGHVLFRKYGVVPDPFISTPITICPIHDKVLICATDGLWECAGFQYGRIVELAMKHYPDAVAAAHELGHLATQRINTDNTIAIVCFF